MIETQSTKLPPARLAGLLYLTVIVVAMFAEGFVRGRLVVSGDATVTVHHILQYPLLYFSGIAADLVVLSCDAALAVLLYLILRPVGEGLALVSAAFRLVYAAIMGLDTAFFAAPLGLLEPDAHLSVVSRANLPELVMMVLRLHAVGYNVALVFFGVHCLLVGVTALRSVIIPHWIGVLMMVAGTCYLVNSFNNLLPSRFSADIFPYILFPGLIGEGALTLRLLLVGVKPDRWRLQLGLTNGAASTPPR